MTDSTWLGSVASEGVPVATDGSFVVAYESLDASRRMACLVLWILVAVALAGLGYWIGRPTHPPQSRLGRWVGRVGQGVIVLAGLVIYGFLTQDIVLDLTQGEWVEGEVRGFARNDWRGGSHTEVRFSVGDVDFRYTHIGGERRITELHQWGKGPLRDGLYVRVKYREHRFHPKILKVEVRDIAPADAGASADRAGTGHCHFWRPGSRHSVRTGCCLTRLPITRVRSFLEPGVASDSALLSRWFGFSLPGAAVEPRQVS